jgi:cytochrome c oxidase subunit 6b
MARNWWMSDDINGDSVTVTTHVFNHSHRLPPPPPTSPAMSETQAAKRIFQTAEFDARFPNQNQTKHCYQNYLDYHKCITAKGEDFAPCQQFWRAFHSLCPNEWITRFDEQRAAGNFPSSTEP